MRPRVFPAEDRGRLVRIELEEDASMRPRVFPAEDAKRRTNSHPRSWCFNEAAGIPRGRHGERTAPHDDSGVLQ